VKRSSLKRQSPKRQSGDPRQQAGRAALNALRKARRTADRAGVELSDWEGEFLGSVSARVETFGRAFGDPEKGAAGAALSVLQTVKLKEITAKAKGEPRRGVQRGRRRPAAPADEG
jgi:hypothetical protein